MKLTNLMILTGLAIAVMASGASASDLRPGESVRGITSGAGSESVFTVDLAAGDEIKLTLKARGAGDAPSLAVTDPDGSTVAESARSRRAKVAFTAAETGTYGIRVAAGAETAARYTLKMSGPARRTYQGAGSVAFGAPRGALVDMKFKGAHADTAVMRDSRSRQIALLVRGTKKARAGELAATDDYRVEAGSAEIKVKVRYPDSRGDLVFTMGSAGGSYGGPAGDPGQPAGQDPAEEPAPGGHDGEDDGQGNEGEVTGGANDGSVGGGNGGNGTVPAAPVTDHEALVEMLSAEEDLEVRAARIMLATGPDQDVFEALNTVRIWIPDEVVFEIEQILEIETGLEQAMPAAGSQMILDIVAAMRRADRAQRRAVALDGVAPGTALDADVAYGPARQSLDAAIAATRAAAAQAMAEALPVLIRDEQYGPDDENAPAEANLAAPDAVDATPERVAGMVALDAAVAASLQQRAQDGERDALQALRVITVAYDRMLRALPNLDPNVAQTLAGLQQRLAALDAMETAQYGVEFELLREGMEQPSQDGAAEADEIVIRVLGTDARNVSFDIEGDYLSSRVDAESLRIQMDAHDDPRILTVRGTYEGEEREIRISIEPRDPEAPAPRTVIGRILGPDGPLADAHIELRADPVGDVLADAVADEAGRFVFENIEPMGSAHLLVIDPRYGEREFQIHIEDEQQTDLGDFQIDDE